MSRNTCMSSLKISTTHPHLKPSNNNAASTRCTPSAPFHADIMKLFITLPSWSIPKATFSNSSTSFTSLISTFRGKSHTNNLKHSLRETKYVSFKLNTVLWALPSAMTSDLLSSAYLWGKKERQCYFILEVSTRQLGLCTGNCYWEQEHSIINVLQWASAWRSSKKTQLSINRGHIPPWLTPSEKSLLLWMKIQLLLIMISTPTTRIKCVNRFPYQNRRDTIFTSCRKCSDRQIHHLIKCE